MARHHIILFSSLVILFLNLASASPTERSVEDRCIDFELNKVDAITSLANGSYFLVNHDRYWVLKPNEIPSLATARPVSKLIPSLEQVEPNVVVSYEKPTTGAPPPSHPTLSAAVNIRVKAQNGACVPTNQILLYFWSQANKSEVAIYEKDVLSPPVSIASLDIFRAAKSVDWNRKIDGLAFWQNMTIIFQGNSFISIRCQHGEWQELVHKNIVEVFPGISRASLDSVVIKATDPDQLEQATVYMFFGHDFYECSVTGNDPCEGPYNLMSEFFNADHYCPDSKLGRAESSRRFMTAIILIIIILFCVCVVGAILYFTLKPEHFTYFVNGKMRSNYNRDNLSYEALKIQSETGNGAAAGGVAGATNGSSGVECKSVTNGNGKS